LAYAVGRTKGKSKIKDFYEVMCVAIDSVTQEEHFKNFIKIFEAIVAYHKAAEEGKINNNN
jgi:CRISPR type III-A-associated protein Csm2